MQALDGFVELDDQQRQAQYLRYLAGEGFDGMNLLVAKGVCSTGDQ